MWFSKQPLTHYFSFVYAFLFDSSLTILFNGCHGDKAERKMSNHANKVSVEQDGGNRCLTRKAEENIYKLVRRQWREDQKGFLLQSVRRQTRILLS